MTNHVEPLWHFDFAGSVALVTGSRGPLGARIANALQELGANVVGVDVTPLDSRSSTHPQEQLELVCDLTTAGSAVDVVNAAVEHFGRLDILVNNAAFTGSAGLPGYAVELSSQTEHAWELALRLNLTVPFLMCQAARDHLERSDRASIVNIGSVYASIAPDPRMYLGTELGNPAAYGASKAGLIQLTRHLAAALSPLVRVNAVSPGGIFRDQDPTFVERYDLKVPLARMATEEEIVAPVLFLASQMASYITGQELLVDGGLSSW